MRKSKKRTRKPVKPPQGPSKNLTRLLFAAYLLIMTWVVLLNRATDFGQLAELERRSLNLIPFAASATANGKIDLPEIAWKVAAFVPFGVYITMLHKSWSFPKKLLPIVGVSLTYEVLQYGFAIGDTDITDLLCNMLGGLLGMGIFLLLWAILGRRALHWINAAAAVGTGTAILILGVPILLHR